MTGRSPRLAWHLSFWVPGLGQLYRREWGKGAAFLAGSTALSDRALDLYPLRALAACTLPQRPLALTAVVGALVACWVLAVVDAGRVPDAETRRDAPGRAG